MVWACKNGDLDQVKVIVERPVRKWQTSRCSVGVWSVTSSTFCLRAPLHGIARLRHSEVLYLFEKVLEWQIENTIFLKFHLIVSKGASKLVPQQRTGSKQICYG